MSDEWIVRKTEEMLKYGDAQVRETATLIQNARHPTSSVDVQKLLMEHNLETGMVQCFEVSAEGAKGVMKWENNCEKTMQRVLAEYRARTTGVGELAEEGLEDIAEAKGF